MKKLIRAIVFVIVVLVVLVVAGVVGVALFADRAVKSAVESAGTKTLNVPVRVGDADASILGGSVGLQSLAVKPTRRATTARSLLTLQSRQRQGRHRLAPERRNRHQEHAAGPHGGLRRAKRPPEQPLRGHQAPAGAPRAHRQAADHRQPHDLRHPRARQPARAPGPAGADRGPQDRPDHDDRAGPRRADGHRRADQQGPAGGRGQGIAEQSGDILPQETLGEITGVLDKAIDLGRTIFGGKKPADQPDPKTGTGDPGQKALEGLQDLLGGKKK